MYTILCLLGILILSHDTNVGSNINGFSKKGISINDINRVFSSDLDKFPTSRELYV